MEMSKVVSLLRTAQSLLTGRTITLEYIGPATGHPAKPEPRSADGNVSVNRCESNCRSRGSEFEPGPEIDHEIISTVILLPSAESFKKGCCQLQAKVCARSTG